MKKYLLIIASCILLAATACGNDTPSAKTETTVPTETTQTVTETTEATTTAETEPETTEKVAEVTMDNINEVFSLENPAGEYEGFNPLFLCCFYDKPSGMDLRTILYHGIGGKYELSYNANEISEQEILDVGLNLDGVKTVGAVKFTEDNLNDYLTKKTGLTIDEFENQDMKFKYNEQYDAYYGYSASDTILQPLNFTGVEMNGDVYTAVYTTPDYITYSDSDITCQVEFKVNDGAVQFISNKQIETEE